MNRYRCRIFPGTRVQAYVRLLVEPPVTIEWPTFKQTLSIIAQDYRPFGIIRLSTHDGGPWDMHFDTAGHAYHVAMHGIRINAPSPHHTFFRKLTTEGRAEYVWGPHSELAWEPWPKEMPHPPDARFTYARHHGLKDPRHDLPPNFA